MADDVKLQILLQAKNQSEQAFRELKSQLGGLQQEFAKTAQAAQAGLDFDRFKAGAVSAIASVYAAYKSLGQLQDLAEMGAKLDKQAASFKNLAAAAGTSAENILNGLKRASRGLVAEADLMASAGKALLMNIPAAEITKLMEVAAATSRMTGQTVTEAFGDITMGVARQSKMILDNLGIIVDVDRAYNDYAKTLGKTADSLTDAEKRQAFMNAVLKSGEDMVRRIGAAQDDLAGVNKLLAAQRDLWDEVSKTVARFLDKELASYAKILTWITDKLKGARQAAGEGSAEDLRKEIAMLQSLEAKGMARPGLAAAKQAEYARRFGLPSEAQAADERSMAEWRKPDWYAAWREREGQWADFTADELKAMREAREKYLKDVEDQKKKEQERIARIWADYQPRYAESQLSEAMLADQKVFEEWKKVWADYKQRLPESQESEAFLADQKAFEEWKKTSKESFDFFVELSAHTAERMQDNFSDLFFDAFTGKLKSLSDYANAIFNSIQRAAADMAGQLATQAIFGGQSVGGTAGGGGLIGWISGLFGGGSSSMNQTTALALVRHSGGEVDGAGPYRQVPAWVMAAAPRLHSGLAPDEYPAILQRGERVLSRREAQAPAAQITVNVQAPAGRLDRESIAGLQTALYATLQRAGRRNA